jgi:subtilisin family serine protease
LSGCGSQNGDFNAGSDEVAETPAALTPTDPKFALQWGLNNTGQTISANGNPASQTGVKGVDINLIKAWDVSQGSSSVIVAVIDENPIKLDHEDLKSAIFVNTREVAGDGKDNDGNGFVDDVSGYNFNGNPGDPSSDNHGTLTAGIIAAAASNGKGGTGVAPRVRILPLVASVGSPATVIAAIQYAKSMGAKIVNLSQSSTVFSQPLYDAIKASGLLFTVCAGNFGTAVYQYPASFDLPNILSVANVENVGRLALTSNYGLAHVDIAAPGWNIYGPLAADANGAFSTKSYGYESGTSFAAPHVAGVAALVMSQFPSLTVSQVIARILGAGSKLDDLDGMVQTGALVDAYAALSDVAPIGLVAKSIAGKTTLTWSAQSGATRYDVEVDGVVLANGTSTSYVHGGLVTGSAHIYRVRAVVGSSLGLWSARWIKKASAPAASASVSFASSHSYPNNLVKDTYIPATNATSMRVHFSRVEVAPTTDDDSNDCLFYYPSEQEGVDACGNPRYSLRAKYATGFWTRFGSVPFHLYFQSDASLTAWGYAVDKIEYFTGIPEVPPDAYSSASTSSSITLGLSASSGATQVSVYRASSATGSYSKVGSVAVDASGSPADFTNTGLSAHKTYYYKTSATNGLGESALTATPVVASTL